MFSIIQDCHKKAGNYKIKVGKIVPSAQIVNMTNEQIEKFLASTKAGSLIRISFKTRNAIAGIFIKTPEFDDLKSKNFWRIVSETNFEKWQKSKDMNLCRMFNGAEFTKLAIA